MYSTVDVYNVVTKQWNSTAGGVGQLSVPRSSLAAAASHTKIIFAGGKYDDDHIIFSLFS